MMENSGIYVTGDILPDSFFVIAYTIAHPKFSSGS